VVLRRDPSRRAQIRLRTISDRPARPPLEPRDGDVTAETVR